jgi:hypothetical protein
MNHLHPHLSWHAGSWGPSSKGTRVFTRTSVFLFAFLYSVGRKYTKCVSWSKLRLKLRDRFHWNIFYVPLPFYITFYVLTLIIIAYLCVDIFFFFRTFPLPVLLSIVYNYLHHFVLSCYLFIHGFVYLLAYFKLRIIYVMLKTTGMNYLQK